jgi:hypothetical protein
MERILALKPMSQFDALAIPMDASFTAQAELAPYTAVSETVPMSERNRAGTRAAALSRHFDFSREDAIDDQAFNRAIWAAVRGDDAVLPAPVHAAFVRQIPSAHGGDDDDDDD